MFEACIAIIIAILLFLFLLFTNILMEWKLFSKRRKREEEETEREEEKNEEEDEDLFICFIDLTDRAGHGDDHSRDNKHFQVRRNDRACRRDHR